MSKISSDLLNDTINLVQLARETALARGNQTQAEKLAPVASNLQSLAVSTRQSKPVPADGGIVGQPDFQRLLNAIQSKPKENPQPAFSSERNQVIFAMASAGMVDAEIARHLGVTREEVRLYLNVRGDRR